MVAIFFITFCLSHLQSENMVRKLDNSSLGSYLVGSETVFERITLFSSQYKTTFHIKMGKLSFFSYFNDINLTDR